MYIVIYAQFTECNTGADPCSLQPRTILVQFINALLVATTIQAQDFPDVEGDYINGRKTLPLVFPRGSRTLMALILPSWSAALGHFWDLGPGISLILNILSIFLAVRYLVLRTKSSDKTSYIIYNVRMSA